MILLAAGFGALLALLSLIPGLHAATLLLFILPWLGGDNALVAAAVFTGASTVLSILQACYHPVAANMLANADVAAKLAYDGMGKDVVWVHQRAVRRATGIITVIGVTAALLTMCGVDILRWTADGIRPVVGIILVLAVGLTIGRAGHPIRTLLVSLGAGLVGFLTFSSPALAGNEWSMAPLLGGMFMVPSAWGLILAEKPLALPNDRKRWIDPTPSGDQEMTGTLIGMTTGFLAGIGTGSLVALIRQKDGAEFDYLALASASEAGNNLFALLAFSLIGVSRSGTAVALGQAAPQTDAFSALICCLAMVLGVFLGERMLGLLHISYRRLIQAMPQQVMGLALLLAGTGIALWHTGLAGAYVMGAAWMVSSLAKSWATPNQALMTALIGPVLIYELGYTRVLAGALGIL